MADTKINVVRDFKYEGCTYSKKPDGSINQSCSSDVSEKPPLSTYYKIVSDQLKLIDFFEKKSRLIKETVKMAGATCEDVPTMLQNFREATPVFGWGRTVQDGVYELRIGDDYFGKSRLTLFDHDKNGKIDEIQVRTLRYEGKTEIASLFLQVYGKDFENLFDQLLFIGAKECLKAE